MYVTNIRINEGLKMNDDTLLKNTEIEIDDEPKKSDKKTEKEVKPTASPTKMDAGFIKDAKEKLVQFKKLESPV